MNTVKLRLASILVALLCIVAPCWPQREGGVNQGAQSTKSNAVKAVMHFRADLRGICSHVFMSET